MMRRTKRPAIAQLAFRDQASDGLDHRDFQQFARQEGRQDRGQALRQHRLSRPWRAAHQDIMLHLSPRISKPCLRSCLIRFRLPIKTNPGMHDVKVADPWTMPLAKPDRMTVS